MDITNKPKKYHTGNHLVYSCQYHVIFCPKYRRKVLVDGVDVRLKEIILELAELHSFTVIEMEVMPDHVHLLLDCDPKISVMNYVSKIKGASSNKLRKEFPWLKSRLPTLWTRSCFVSSVGSTSLEVVKQYIENQKHV